METNPLDMSHAPWGTWEVLCDTSYCKVKRITVKPGQRLSYQKHFKREELWTVVKGVATVVLNGKTSELVPGETVFIPQEALHRVGNQGEEDVVLIEIQRGSYFGEDDIVRIEDDYSRQ